MNKVILTLATAAMMVTAFADKTPKDVVCAVMPKDKVNIVKATKAKLFSDYKGNRYYFCCEGCKPTFDKSPEKFKSAPHVPTPKPVKKAK